MKRTKLKKKITLKEWTYIGKANYAAKWCRRLCSYSLIREDDKTFVRVQKMNLFIYLLLFIPVHILQAFVCMWDGGLSEFTILGRVTGQDTLSIGSPAYEKAEGIWNSCANSKKSKKFL